LNTILRARPNGCSLKEQSARLYRVTCKSQCGEINESAWETPEGFRSQTREHGTRTRLLIALQRNVRKTSESTSEGTIDTFVGSYEGTVLSKVLSYFRTFVKKRKKKYENTVSIFVLFEGTVHVLSVHVVVLYVYNVISARL